MIDPSRKEANDLVKDEIRNSELDTMMKEALIQDLTESLEGTNGHEAKEKLQIVSECTEVQARIIARLCKMESDHHKTMRASLDKMSSKLDDNMKSINNTLGKMVSTTKDGTVIKNSDGNIELKTRSQWFTFITTNKIQVFWFSIIVVVLAFITGNLDKISTLIHGGG